MIMRCADVSLWATVQVWMSIIWNLSYRLRIASNLLHEPVPQMACAEGNGKAKGTTDVNPPFTKRPILLTHIQQKEK